MFNVGIVQSRRLVVFCANLIFVTFFATLVGCSQATTDPNVMIMQVHELEEQAPTVEMMATYLNLSEHRFKIKSVGAESRLRFTYKVFVDGEVAETHCYENATTNLKDDEELPIRLGTANGIPADYRRQWWFAKSDRWGFGHFWVDPESINASLTSMSGHGPVGLGETSMIYGRAYFKSGFQVNEDSFFDSCLFGVGFFVTVECLDGVESRLDCFFDDPDQLRQFPRKSAPAELHQFPFDIAIHNPVA